MDDVEDVLEAIVDVEDVAEEVFEPEELFEDLVEEPLTIALALIVAGAALVTLLLLLATLLVLAFRIGFLWILVGLTLVGLLVTGLALAAFLYVRTDVPRRVQRKIDEARSQADETRSQADEAPHGDARMSEEEAIEELRELYAEREITTHELEEGLEEIMAGDDPEAVVREYEREYEAAYERETERN